MRESYARDVYDHSGKYFQFPNIRLTTKPVQKPFLLWVGGFGEQLATRAGREGYHLQAAVRMHQSTSPRCARNGF